MFQKLKPLTILKKKINLSSLKMMEINSNCTAFPSPFINEYIHIFKLYILFTRLIKYMKNLSLLKLLSIFFFLPLLLSYHP